MPKLSKNKHNFLSAELDNRYQRILTLFDERTLSVNEKKSFNMPEVMVGTTGTKIELSTAIDDLITILRKIEDL